MGTFFREMDSFNSVASCCGFHLGQPAAQANAANTAFADGRAIFSLFESLGSEIIAVLVA